MDKEANARLLLALKWFCWPVGFTLTTLWMWGAFFHWVEVSGWMILPILGHMVVWFILVCIAFVWAGMNFEKAESLLSK